MTPEIGPTSFGTFEKQAPVPEIYRIWNVLTVRLEGPMWRPVSHDFLIAADRDRDQNRRV